MKSTTSAKAVSIGARSAPGRVALDLLALVRPRIALLVAFSAFVGGLLAAGPGGNLARVAEAALWITCAAGAASAFNQVLERDVDRLMVRTRERPLPTGRLSMRDAIGLAGFLAVAAVVGLATRFNLLAALLALATICAYALVYTPLKRVSTLNTVVGAVPGAAPPLIGYVALAGSTGGWAWALFAIVFVWQFPHFMAIAYLHRADYAAAGLRMLPALPGCEHVAARAALTYSLTLLPVSLLPGLWGDAGIVYTLGALALGLAYAGSAAVFARRSDARSARMLLLVSLAYLPLLFALILLDPVVGASAGVGAVHG